MAYKQIVLILSDIFSLKSFKYNIQLKGIETNLHCLTYYNIYYC